MSTLSTRASPPVSCVSPPARPSLSPSTSTSRRSSRRADLRFSLDRGTKNNSDKMTAKEKSLPDPDQPTRLHPYPPFRFSDNTALPAFWISCFFIHVYTLFWDLGFCTCYSFMLGLLWISFTPLPFRDLWLSSFFCSCKWTGEKFCLLVFFSVY